MVTIQKLILGQQTTPIGNPARPKNERILLAAVKEEVTSLLRQSLHNAVLINLGKESQPQQVKRPWDAEIKIGLKPAEPLPNTTTILQVFDSQEVAGKLLILGNPGSGKTTTQLELAQELIKRAQEQPDYPVPVLFNLSSWKDDRQSITDWLLAELKSKYGVSKKLGQEWVNNHQLLPLLDGLDELEPQRQELCVNAINHFLASETRPLYLVICSRSEEYSSYSRQLQINGAIYLQPLTNNQICDYLTSIKYIELWSTISNDLDLLDLVKTPLILSISVLAFGEISAQKWQYLNSTSDRLQYLLDAYIARMFTRDIQSRVYTRGNIPSLKQTRIWLICLARTLQEQSQTIFSSEEIQALSRLQKYWRGEMPWNYRRFLDYATERLILQRIGRQYMFIHKLLQDHFARMSLPQD
ncbi:NACHT domain-containing protein [Calothrix sp. FACHB-156]|nr:NACHT domain-containing protein [Calothrix sp. FACHB-156]